jgi:hypothetical protein
MNKEYIYSDTYCDKIIKHCENGGFIETLPAVLNIPFSVLKNWSQTKQELDDAISIGLSHTIQYYLKKLDTVLSCEMCDAIKVTTYRALIDRCFKLYDDKINVNELGNKNHSGIRTTKNAGLMNLD